MTNKDYVYEWLNRNISKQCYLETLNYKGKIEVDFKRFRDKSSYLYYDKNEVISHVNKVFKIIVVNNKKITFSEDDFRTLFINVLKALTEEEFHENFKIKNVLFKDDDYYNEFKEWFLSFKDQEQPDISIDSKKIYTIDYTISKDMYDILIALKNVYKLTEWKGV